MHYTPAQTRLFLVAIEDLAVAEHRRDVIGQRIAGADAPAVQAYLEGRPLPTAPKSMRAPAPRT